MKPLYFVLGILLTAGLAWLIFSSSESAPDMSGGLSSPTDLAASGVASPKPQPTENVAATMRARAVPASLESADDIHSLFNPAAVTHHAVQDGDWSDPATWGGTVPKAGARVHIPADRQVRISRVDDTHFKAVTVDGALVMARDASTSLVVDTLQINATGSLRAGTAARPVLPHVEAHISIVPYYDANESEAAREHSAMLLALGEVSLHGSPKSALIPLKRVPQIGDTILYLQDTPAHWAANDLLAIGGNRLARDDGETLMLASLEGTRVTVVDAAEPPNWQGLTGDYEPDSDRLPFVVNLSRNVALTSTPPDGSSAITQCAALFMGEGVGKASMSNIGVYGLGMVEGSVDGVATTQTRPAFSFVDGSGVAEISNLALIDAPDSSLHVENSQLSIAHSVAYDSDGASWLTDTATPSRLLWAGKRSTRTLP